MITGEDPLSRAACARTIGPSFNAGSEEGVVAEDGASAPNDNTAASATCTVLREATLTLLPGPDFCRLAIRNTVGMI
jgi:hypothetical protein